MAKTHVRAQSNLHILFVAITTLLLLAFFGIFSFAQAQEGGEATQPAEVVVIPEPPVDNPTPTDDAAVNEEEGTETGKEAKKTEEPDEEVKKTDEESSEPQQESFSALAFIEEPKLGSISGCKYFDETDDSELNMQQPLSGWQFRLYQSPNAPWKQFPENQAIAIAETDESGCYSFGELEPGIYQVFERVQPGWVQTYPPLTTDHNLTVPAQDGGNVLPQSLTPTPVPAGTDQADPIWNWLNTKLTQNPTMFAILGNAMDCLFNKNCDFNQRAELTSIRYYTIHLGTNVEANEVMDVDNAHFGNFRGVGTITGMKFNDLDKDGKKDEDEPGLPGWEIQLFSFANAPWQEGASSTPIQTVITDEDGNYTFSNIPSGAYQIFEVQQDGWRQSAPRPHFTVKPSGLTLTEQQELILVNDATNQKLLGCALETTECPDVLHQELLNLRYYAVLLKPNAILENADFGNYIKTSEIRGTKFEDVDEDGVRDPEENGIPGWEIQLFQNPNAPWEEDLLNVALATTTTDAEGNFIFDNLMPGVYQVYEKPQLDTWTPTAPTGSQPTTLPIGLAGIDLVKAKLTENPSGQKLLGCAASIIPCSDELHDELLNLKYFSIVLNAGEVVDGADFGNHHKPLVIEDEETENLATDSMTIEWITDRFATSRVVYGTTSVADISAESAPNYGYEFSTPLYDTDPKVQNHSVTINGLTPGTTYYWRAISSASPEVVGNENSVVTPQPQVQQQQQENTPTQTQNITNNFVTLYTTPLGGTTEDVTPTQSESLIEDKTSQLFIPNQPETQSVFANTRIAQVSETNRIPAQAQVSETIPAEDKSSATFEEVVPDVVSSPNEDETQVAAVSFAGLSGAPLWGVFGLALVLILVALRIVARKS
jgi:protocatechuate 3,4-dioxygenase beta subunit